MHLKKILLALSFFSLLSCSSFPVIDKTAIRSDLETVDVADGLDQREAVVIAKNYMLDNGHDYDWNVAAPESEYVQEKSYWSISFSPLENGWGSGRRPSSEIELRHLMPYFVYVDAADGSLSVMKIRIETEH